MNLLVAFLAACQLFTLAIANPAASGFYFYAGYDFMFKELIEKWIGSMYPDRPDCDMATEYVDYEVKTDVSGKKLGIVCDPQGCIGDPAKMDRIEMNTDFGHYTWYRNRDNALVDLQDRVVGHCHDQRDFYETDKLACTYIVTGDKWRLTLYPVLYCVTNVFSK